MACTYDYSYICSECQERIDRENADDYANERLDRLEALVDAIATKLGIEVPPRCEERGRLERGRY